MLNSLLFLFLFLLAGQPLAETTDLEIELRELRFLAGSWLGELEYLDYGDDRTPVVLPMGAKFTATETGFNFTFAIEEPSGEEAISEGGLEIAEGGSGLIFDGERLKAVEEQSGPDRYRLVLNSRGADNGRPADYRTTLHFEKGQLRITRRVTLDEGGRSFVRNEYRLRRETGSSPNFKPDPQSLLGTWTVDLRPSPDAAPHEIEFRVESVAGDSLSGVFYESPIESGKINAEWGEIRFGFLTRDGSGPYYTSGVLRDDKLTGTTQSYGRQFLSVWQAVRKVD